MGLFDSIAGQVLGQLTQGNGPNGGPGGLLEAVGGLINSHPGGLQGLVSAFEQQGLGGVVASWVGTGQNLPISGEQIQAVLGNEQVAAIAQGLGFSPQEASGKLAEFLPQVVDKLTPNGNLPEGEGLSVATLMGLLGGLKG
jgi:uncharacterized protein YidB (DUF937 family)